MNETNQANEVTSAQFDASKGCQCLKTIRESLAAHHGQNCDICLELKRTIDTKTFELGEEVPPLGYTYRVGKKRKRSYVSFNFCPFCGIRRT